MQDGLNRVLIPILTGVEKWKVGEAHQQATLRCHLGILQINSTVTLVWDSARFHGLRGGSLLQDCSPFPQLQMPIAKPRSSPVPLTDWLWFEGSNDSLLGFNYLPRTAHRTLRNILRTRALVYYKRISRNSQIEEVHKAGCEERAGSLHALRAPLSLYRHVFTNPELSKPHTFGFLWRLHCIHIIDGITGHWWLKLPASFTSLEIRGWDWRHQCSIPGWFPWQTSPCLQVFQNHLIDRSLVMVERGLL